MKKQRKTENELKATLYKYDCSVPQAARELGITRAGVYWLMKEYGLKIEKKKCLTSIKQ